MNRKLAIIIGLQTFLIVMLFWVLIFYSKDEYEAATQDTEDQIEAPNHLSNKQGMVVISISSATQTQSDIKTSVLKASSHQNSVSSYGNVIGIDSLIELRSRYLVAKAEAQASKASLEHTKDEYKRLFELNQDEKNVSDKAVAAALADTKADEAKVFAAEASAKNIADNMRQAWGEVLTQLATENNVSTLLQNIISYKEALIQITLPFDSAEPKSNSSITISPITSSSNFAAHSINAQYLSRAPISNTIVQGKTYFYHAKTTDLRAGMQVKIISAQSKRLVGGVIIPNTAVVWYGGKPWVYRKVDNDQFYRVPVNTDIEIENGWFYQGSLKPNDAVVTSGAQLLLSEEFKSQITNENED